MHTLDAGALTALFDRLADVFAQQRAFLIELDGKVGDSDLGITMAKGFAAAAQSMQATTADPPGRRLQLAGMAMAKAAPSTMGTLMATGLMRGGKAVADAPTLGAPEMARFWTGCKDGIAERGKARPGDKTVLDVLGPLADACAAAVAAGHPLPDTLDAAAEAAATALEATRAMVAQHGKAACFPERSVGLQDAGATVAAILVATMRDFVRSEGAAS